MTRPGSPPSACEHIKRALIALRRAGVDMHELAKTPIPIDSHTRLAIAAELGAAFDQRNFRLASCGALFTLVEVER